MPALRTRYLGYLRDIHGWFLPYAVVHFVAIAHLCGGLMLALGLLTRVAAAIQVPILSRRPPQTAWPRA